MYRDAPRTCTGKRDEMRVFNVRKGDIWLTQPTTLDRCFEYTTVIVYTAELPCTTNKDNNKDGIRRQLAACVHYQTTDKQPKTVSKKQLQLACRVHRNLRAFSARTSRQSSQPNGTTANRAKPANPNTRDLQPRQLLYTRQCDPGWVV